MYRFLFSEQWSRRLYREAIDIRKTDGRFEKKETF